jgi:mRNA interferase YafQ
MLLSTYTRQFEKDFKLARKRGKNLNKLNLIAKMLVNQERLAQNHRDHALRGDYINCRECHIEPDWLLIYEIKKDEIVFHRLGTHSDLFD